MDYANVNRILQAKYVGHLEILDRIMENVSSSQILMFVESSTKFGSRNSPFD